MRTTPLPDVPAWPYTAAALLALAILAVGSGPSPALFVPALGLLAVYVFPFRVERATRAAWLARLTLFCLTLTLNAGHPTLLMDAWGPAPNLDVMAELCAAEMVLRAWHRPPNTRQMLLLSGLIVLVGCATSDDRVGLYLVPPYFFCVVLALRSDRPRPTEQTRLGPVLRRAGAVALAFVIGGVAQWSFRTYKSEITDWGSSVLGEHPHSGEGAEVSGIAKDPTLGPTFGSPGSSARILRVVGSLPDPHLHGMAFDTYARGAWRPTLADRHFEAATPTDLGVGAPGPRVRITRFVDDDGMVSAPLSSAGIALDAQAEPTWAREQGGPVRDETSDALVYQVVSGHTEEFQGPLCVPPSPAERSLCLAVPAEISPGVRALAQRIAGSLSGPRQRVEAVRDYLLNSNAYSLRTDPGRGDPVSNFLLQHKAAHCEFFASAAAILLRCVGVPTRYAIGYYAHESDGPGVTVVRGQDAHAWAESWIEGTGWVVVDATPGDGRPDHTAKTPFWWKLRDRWQDLTLALRAGFTRLAGPRRLLLAGLAAFLLVPSVLRNLRSHRPTPGPTFVYALPSLELAELASLFEAWLARHGAACPPDRPWQEHLAVIAQGKTGDDVAGTPAGPAGVTPPRLQRASAFVAAYNRARFGADNSPQARAQAAEALRRLESERMESER